MQYKLTSRNVLLADAVAARYPTHYRSRAGPAGLYPRHPGTLVPVSAPSHFSLPSLFLLSLLSQRPISAPSQRASLAPPQ